MRKKDSDNTVLTRIFLRLCAWNLTARNFGAVKVGDQSAASAESAVLELASALALWTWLILMLLAVAYSYLYSVPPNRITLLVMPYKTTVWTILLPSFLGHYLWLRIKLHPIGMNADLVEKYNSRPDRVILFVGTVALAASVILGAITIGFLSR